MPGWASRTPQARPLPLLSYASALDPGAEDPGPSPFCCRPLPRSGRGMAGEGKENTRTVGALWPVGPGRGHSPWTPEPVLAPPAAEFPARGREGGWGVCQRSPRHPTVTCTPAGPASQSVSASLPTFALRCPQLCPACRPKRRAPSPGQACGGQVPAPEGWRTNGDGLFST